MRRILLLFAEEQRMLRRRPPPKNLAHSELLKVAVIGAPNAGKSALANKLVGWKVYYMMIFASFYYDVKYS